MKNSATTLANLLTPFIRPPLKIRKSASDLGQSDQEKSKLKNCGIDRKSIDALYGNAIYSESSRFADWSFFLEISLLATAFFLILGFNWSIHSGTSQPD